MEAWLDEARVRSRLTYISCRLLLAMALLWTLLTFGFWTQPTLTVCVVIFFLLWRLVTELANIRQLQLGINAQDKWQWLMGVF